jgi:glycosyltransferase involved in cell wall biosynthesis
MFFLIAIAVLSIFYLIVQTVYTEGWKALPIWKIPVDFEAKTTISILIPARNEAENIGDCIDSILNQTYPKHLFEIIILDDFSEDKTPEIVANYEKDSFKNVRLIKVSDNISADETQSFKKKAIEIGIKNASGELIVTTDADCIAQPNWLEFIGSLYDLKQPKFIAAPVNFHQEQNDFERFQSLDFIGMMGITGSGIYTKIMRMCNGANLAYPKTVFEEVKGFQGIDSHASGDDMMLMQKIARIYPNDILYLKNQNATIFTTAKPTLKSFINQRVRWSTKSKGYEEKQVTLILIGVWLFCVSIPFTFLATIFFGKIMLAAGFGQLLIKTFADYRLLKTTSTFFNRSGLMQNFWKSSFYHLIYIIAVGFLSGIVKKYEWKGRLVQ